MRRGDLCRFTIDPSRYEVITDAGSQFNSHIVNSTSGNGQADFDPTVVGLTGGDSIIARSNTDSIDTDVSFQRYTNTGSAVGSQPDGAPGSPNHDNEVDLLAPEDGSFGAVRDDDNTGELKLKHYGPTGSQLGTTGTFETGIGASDLLSTGLLNGRFMVTWRDPSFEIRAEIYDTRDNANATAVYDPESRKVGTIGDDNACIAGADFVNTMADNDTVSWPPNPSVVDGGTGIVTISINGTLALGATFTLQSENDGFNGTHNHQE